MDPSEYHVETAAYGVDLAKYGKEEEEFLLGALEGFWTSAEKGEYEYVDNIRLARQGDADCAEYEEIRQGGCCGFMDTEFGPSPGGHTYLYGFNHGH